MSENKFLYFSVKNQNDALISRKKDLTDKYSIDNQKVYYELQEIASMQNTNNILLIIFYILSVIVIFFIFRQSTAIYIKIIISILILAFPFYSIPIEKIIFNGFRYIDAFVNSNIYKKY